MSKILKQNGSNGKIMRAQNSGKVLKQNYNFPKAMYLAASYEVDIPSLVGVNFDDFSMSMYVKGVGTSISNYNGNFTSEWDGLNVIQCRARPTVQYWKKAGAISNDPARTTTSLAGTDYTKKFYLYMSLNEIQFNTVRKETSLTSFFPALCTGIRLNRYLRDNSTTVYDGSPLTVSELRIYNKVLDAQQVAFEYNNLLGNEVNVNIAIVSSLKFNKAEVFDFGGAIGQAPGIRDYSGKNHHGRIIGLPAGTPQEQVDFANVNLFEIW